jgi:hypothetical protein
MAVTVYLKGRGHMSYTMIQTTLKDLFGIPVSKGFLVNSDKTGKRIAEKEL